MTLFDAMRVPDKAQIRNMSPGEDELPFYCLLQDDALITGFCITTQLLLGTARPEEGRDDVELKITVKVSETSGGAPFAKIQK